MISGKHKNIRAISIERNLSEEEIRDAIKCISNFKWNDGRKIGPEEAMAIMDAFTGGKMDPHLSCREDEDWGDHSGIFVISETVRAIKESNKDAGIAEAIEASIKASGLMVGAKGPEKESTKRAIEEGMDEAMEEQWGGDGEINIEEDIEESREEDREEAKEGAEKRHKKGKRRRKRRRGEYGEAPVKRSLMEELQKRLLKGKGASDKGISQIKEISELIKASPIYASKEMRMLRDLRVAEKSLMTKTKNEEISTHIIVDVSGSMSESWEKAITIMRVIEKTVKKAKVYWGSVNITNPKDPATIRKAIEDMRTCGPGGDDDLHRWIREITPIIDRDNARRRNLIIITDDYTVMENYEAEELIDYVEESRINLIIIGARTTEDEDETYLPNKKLERYGISL